MAKYPALVLLYQNPDLTYIDEALAVDNITLAFPKNEQGDKLRSQANEFLAGIQADGSLKQLEHLWLEEVSKVKEPRIIQISRIQMDESKLLQRLNWNHTVTS